MSIIIRVLQNIKYSSNLKGLQNMVWCLFVTVSRTENINESEEEAILRNIIIK